MRFEESHMAKTEGPACTGLRRAIRAPGADCRGIAALAAMLWMLSEIFFWCSLRSCWLSSYARLRRCSPRTQA